MRHPAPPGLHPSFVSPVAVRVARPESRLPARYGTATRTAIAALPQGPSLRSGLFCPGPSTLIRPHPPHSRARRDFPAWLVIPDAFAVPCGLGDPRVVPCFRCSLCPDMPCSTTSESPPVASSQLLFTGGIGLRHVLKGSALSTPPPSVPGGILLSRLPASLPLRPVSSLAPLTDRTDPRQHAWGQPTRASPSALSPGRSPFQAADMATVPPGKAAPAGLPPARMSTSIAAPIRRVFLLLAPRQAGASTAISARFFLLGSLTPMPPAQGYRILIPQ